MPWRRVAVVVVLVAGLLGLFRALDRTEPDALSVGATVRRFVPPEPYSWRGAATRSLVTTIWYPVDAGIPMSDQHIGPPAAPLFTLGRWADDAPMSQGPFALIVLSHGTGGSAQIMAWLARDLASRGYIVAAVNHPGNTALEPYTAEGFLLWWERARDLTAVIDLALADAVVGPRIDRNRIGAIGFSLGGYTVLELAGARTDPALLQRFCASRDAAECADPPEFPNLFERWTELQADSNEFREMAAQAGRSYRDPRVRAAFAIAPALGPAFVSESLSALDIPVQILAGQDDEIVPLATNARFFARAIPRATLELLPGGHYTFLATCTDTGRLAQPVLCTDPAHVDREVTHRRASELAARFFERTLD